MKTERMEFKMLHTGTINFEFTCTEEPKVRLAPRWKVLLHAIRIFGDHVYEGMELYMDGRTLWIHLVEDTLTLLDDAESEIVIEFGEDGTPCYSSEWANAPMDYEVSTDFPMYDYEH